MRYLGCDTWILTLDTFHVTHDTWHMSCDTQGVVISVFKFMSLAQQVYNKRVDVARLVTAWVSVTHINLIAVSTRVTKAPARSAVLLAAVARVAGAVGGGAAAWLRDRFSGRYVFNTSIPDPSEYQPPSWVLGPAQTALQSGSVVARVVVLVCSFCCSCSSFKCSGCWSWFGGGCSRGVGSVFLTCSRVQIAGCVGGGTLPLVAVQEQAQGGPGSVGPRSTGGTENGKEQLDFFSPTLTSACRVVWS